MHRYCIIICIIFIYGCKSSSLQEKKAVVGGIEDYPIIFNDSISLVYIGNCEKDSIFCIRFENEKTPYVYRAYAQIDNYYATYHHNGIIKEFGSFILNKRILSEQLSDSGVVKKCTRIAEKTGRWFYFNDKGKLYQIAIHKKRGFKILYLNES